MLGWMLNRMKTRIGASDVPTEGSQSRGERLLYCDHIDQDGEGMFRLACEHDLEGIVAKRKPDPYLPEHASWLKIRNQNYSQWVGREELFERERGRILIFKFGTDAL